MNSTLHTDDQPAENQSTRGFLPRCAARGDPGAVRDVVLLFCGQGRQTLGKVDGAVMPQFKGRAEGKTRESDRTRGAGGIDQVLATLEFPQALGAGGAATPRGSTWVAARIGKRRLPDMNAASSATALAQGRTSWRRALITDEFDSRRAGFRYRASDLE